jgi:hypothetical protein
VVYGKGAGNYEHRWYYEGHNYMSKRHQSRSFTEIRLNGEKDWFFVRKAGEELLLLSRNEVWHKPAGGDPELQRLDQPPRFERRPRPSGGPEVAEQYSARRLAFVEEIGKLLDKGGYTWRKLGIDFIRTGAAWPF